MVNLKDKKDLSTVIMQLKTEDTAEALQKGRGGEPMMKLNHRRSNIQIIAEMLRTGENGAGKTKIMYSTNMSYSQLQKYLSFLIGHGFISEVHVGNPKVTYQITEIGSRLLKSIESVTEMLGWLEE